MRTTNLAPSFAQNNQPGGDTPVGGDYHTQFTPITIFNKYLGYHNKVSLLLTFTPLSPISVISLPHVIFFTASTYDL